MQTPWPNHHPASAAIIASSADMSYVLACQGVRKGAIRHYYIGSAEGHEYPDLQVGDEVNPRPFFVLS